jgi:hypothetical protein
MSQDLDHALQMLRSLPEPMQDSAARAIIDCVATFEEEQAHA